MILSLPFFNLRTRFFNFDVLSTFHEDHTRLAPSATFSIKVFVRGKLEKKLRNACFLNVPQLKIY